MFCFATVALIAGNLLFLLSTRVTVSWKPLWVLVLALVPHNGEILFNLTNAQAWLSLGLVLLLMAEAPRSRVQAVGDAGFLCLAGATSPHVIFLLPLFALAAWQRRTRHAVILFGLAALLSWLQVWHLLGTRDSGGIDLGDPGWVMGLGVRFGGATLLPPSLLRGMPASLVLVLVGVLHIFLATVLWRTRVRALREAWLAGVLVTIAVLAAYRHAPARLASGGLDHYAFLPGVTLLWVLAGLATSGGPGRRVAALLLVLAVGSAGASFRSRPLQDLRWGRCSEWIGGDVPCDIPLNPFGWMLRYEPAAEGRPTTDDALASVLARTIGTRPLRITPEPAARVAFAGGRPMLAAPPGTVIELPLPIGATRIVGRCAPWPLSHLMTRDDVLRFHVGWRADGGDWQIIHTWEYRPSLERLFWEYHDLDVPLPSDAQGVVGFASVSLGGHPELYQALWGGLHVR
ncbi:MAG: hypothetical protein CMJ83_19410 [Planctomycetes bacterium]|nr:hypothetical protein [Planctomycetota bacterium]